MSPSNLLGSLTPTHILATQCQEFPIPNMLNTYTHTTSPSNDTPHDHYKPYQQETLAHHPTIPTTTFLLQQLSLRPPNTTIHYDQPTTVTMTQCTQQPIPKRIHPYPTGTHDPGHSDLGHLGHTGQGPFGTTVNHAPSLFIYKRIPGT